MTKLPHLADDRQQGASLVRQLVLDPRGRLGIAPPQHHAVLLEHVEPLRERPRADPGTCVLELLEAPRAFREIVEDQRRPLRCDDLRGRSDGARFIVDVVHRPSHRAGVYSPCGAAAIESEASQASSHSRTERAVARPSAIAQTISDWPRRASPVTKTPSPARSTSPGSGPTKPIASSTSSDGRTSSVPGKSSK